MCNDALKSSSKELRRMVSAKTMLNYPDGPIPFTVHNDASDEQLISVISQNNKIFSSSQNIEQANSVTTIRPRRNFL